MWLIIETQEEYKIPVTIARVQEELPPQSTYDRTFTTAILHIDKLEGIVNIPDNELIAELTRRMES